MKDSLFLLDMDSNVTIVTGLWDLGRGELKEWMRRDFEHYKKKFFEMIQSNIPMCIWIPSSLKDEVMSIRSEHNTKIFIKEVKDFETWFPFFEKHEKIRTDPEWYNVEGWLADSPQAALKYYNPMMMCKVFMLNDSAIINPFNTEYFYWIDGGLTNTVSKEYFTDGKLFRNIPNYSEKFIHISYPYKPNKEVHGFPADKMYKYLNIDSSEKILISRGGFFGGKKQDVHTYNHLYYSILQETIDNGHIGADECVFTIVKYQNKHFIESYQVEENGLVWPFFEEIKNLKEKKDKVGLYVITFNSPKQFETLIKSMLNYDVNFINKTKKFLLDNSTDLSTTPRYKELCEEYGFEHIKKDNIGIVGGRVFVAEHFDKSGLDYYMWFEDDMFFHNKGGLCKNGFNRTVANLFSVILEIMEKEEFDFLKLNYTEFFGDNSVQWAWYNVPQEFRENHWPKKTKLPEYGLDPNAPKTLFKNIKTHNGVPYATGEIFLCNWPIILSKKGNYKCYLETKFDSPFEQSLMSHVFQETVKGKINPGLLLLTPTEHNRFEHYARELRKEC